MQQYFQCACSVADILRRHISLANAAGRTGGLRSDPAERYVPDHRHPGAAARALIDEHQLNKGRRLGDFLAKPLLTPTTRKRWNAGMRAGKSVVAVP